jgi:hypothetical protein
MESSKSKMRQDGGMLVFFIKKWFFDLWDHLFATLLINLAFLVLFSGWMLFPGLAAKGGVLISSLASFFMLLLLCITAGLISRYCWDFTRGRNFDITNLLDYLGSSWKPSTVFSCCVFSLGFLIQFGLPFYLALHPVLGFAVMILAFWAVILGILAGMWWWPLHTQFEDRIGECAKKSIFLLFDNIAFSLFMMLGALIIIILSILTMSTFPGITGFLLWFQTGVKLRIYKYQYLKTQNKSHSHAVDIPWNGLFVQEKELLGPRSLKGMIFPWKK